MATTAVVERNKQRQKLVDKYRHKREELTRISKDMKQPFEVRAEAMRKLRALPRNSSRVRIRNRCAITGRPRGVYRKFGLCRHMIRYYARLGVVPGLLKSSW